MPPADFILPTTNPFILSLVKAMVPIVLKMEKLDVRPSEHCIEVVKSTTDCPVILAVNHIDRCDPSVVASLSLKCQEDFYYLAARELFDENLGLRGWLMQNSGVYSVIRGTPEDRESKAETISLITEGKQKLVIFPEGDVTGRDDILQPLKRDGIGNMLEAQRICLEHDPNRTVKVIPIAIYYEVSDDAIPQLKHCLSRQEDFLGMSSWSGPIEARVQRILFSLLRHLEQHYGKRSEAKAADQRLAELSFFITTNIANFTNLSGSQNYDQSSINTFLYSVRGRLQRLIDNKTDSPICFDNVLRKENISSFQTAIHDLDRVQHLLILLSTLQQQPTTIDVLWRIIDRMEQLIIGSTTAKGNRIAWLEAGQPISLAKEMTNSDQPNLAIEHTAEHLRSCMQSVLLELKERSLILQETL
jgi:hypothetical protein